MDDPRLPGPRLAARVVVADYTGRHREGYPPWRQADDDAAALRAAAERDAAVIVQQAKQQAAWVTREAAWQAARIREAAEQEAAELRAALAAMSREMSLASQPERLAPLPERPVTRPERRAPRPARRPARKPGGRTRQERAFRLARLGVAAGLLTVLGIGTGEFVVHGGAPFFVFRQGGTGETPGSFTDQQFLVRREAKPAGPKVTTPARKTPASPGSNGGGQGK